MARLNPVEFSMMQSAARRALQKAVELPAFVSMLRDAGIDLSGGRVLDAGCGSGFGTRLLSDRFRPSRLVGIDLMPEQIERARARTPGAELFVADLGATGEPDGAFDAVFVFGVLHHVPAWREALRELSRVLAPGGVLLVEELHGRTARLSDRFLGTSHPKDAFFDWPAFRRGVQSAGLVILDERALALDAARSFLCRKEVS